MTDVILTREDVIDECIREIMTGRTAVNFGHVPSVSRALDWLRMDLEGLKEVPYRKVVKP